MKKEIKEQLKEFWRRYKLLTLLVTLIISVISIIVITFSLHIFIWGLFFSLKLTILSYLIYPLEDLANCMENKIENLKKVRKPIPRE